MAVDRLPQSAELLVDEATDGVREAEHLAAEGASVGDPGLAEALQAEAVPRVALHVLVDGGLEEPLAAPRLTADAAAVARVVPARCAEEPDGGLDESQPRHLLPDEALLQPFERGEEPARLLHDLLLAEEVLKRGEEESVQHPRAIERILLRGARASHAEYDDVVFRGSPHTFLKRLPFSGVVHKRRHRGRMQQHALERLCIHDVDERNNTLEASLFFGAGDPPLPHVRDAVHSTTTVSEGGSLVLSVKLFQVLDCRCYPFDRQAVRLGVGPAERLAVPASLPVRTGARWVVLDRVVNEWDVADGGCRWIVVLLGRHRGYLTSRIFVPMGVLYAAGCAALWLDALDAPDYIRHGLAMTVLVSAIGYRWTIAALVPAVDHVLLVDHYIFATLVYALAIVGHVWVVPEAWRRRTRVVFPVLFLLVTSVLTVEMLARNHCFSSARGALPAEEGGVDGPAGGAEEGLLARKQAHCQGFADHGIPPFAPLAGLVAAGSLRQGEVGTSLRQYKGLLAPRGS